MGIYTYSLLISIKLDHTVGDPSHLLQYRWAQGFGGNKVQVVRDSLGLLENAIDLFQDRFRYDLGRYDSKDLDGRV